MGQPALEPITEDGIRALRANGKTVFLVQGGVDHHLGEEELKHRSLTTSLYDLALNEVRKIVTHGLVKIYNLREFTDTNGQPAVIFYAYFYKVGTPI